MRGAAISVERLSKSYLVGHLTQGGRYQTFREALTRGVRHFGRAALDMAQGRQFLAGDEIEEFWALKDVSFEVSHGEVIGIIGHNGAGKSTLLKILSRITEPTKGRVTIRGRVASLLEVGTGFHPELTGRENIFLNGAILGMTRREVKTKFDEIVDFAEVEKFLDTPVKRYSSGMYMRLAFAVAAHLEPEILVVDEVLSVGDAAFQKKCLGKMKQVSGGEGRTVLFVSHQMPAIQNLCGSVIVMNQGKVVFQGNTESGVAAYLSSFREETAGALRLRLDREGSGRLRFSAVKLRGWDGAARGAFICGEPAVLELHFERQGPENVRSVVIGVRIDDELGQRVMLLYSDTVNQNFSTLPPDADVIEIEMPKLPLKPGRYAYTLHAMADGAIADWVKNAGTFDVEAGDFYGTGKLPPPEQGSFLTDYSFRLSSRAGRNPRPPGNCDRMTLFDRIAKRIAAMSAEYGLSRLDGSPKAALLEKHASAMTSVVRIENQELLFYTPFPGLRFRAETALSREPDTRAWIDGFKTGCVFWDIGANVGVYSLYATLRRQCRSIAFEPAAANYHALARNITLNRFDDRVTAYPVALSGTTRLGVMNLSSESMGASRNQFGDPGEQSPWAQAENHLQGMVGFTIDDFIRQFDPPFPNYLKMDVDGLETDILAGATKTLVDARLKSVLVELGLTDSADTDRGKALLAAAGFELIATGYVEHEGDQRAANHLFARPRTGTEA